MVESITKDIEAPHPGRFTPAARGVLRTSRGRGILQINAARYIARLILKPARSKPRPVGPRSYAPRFQGVLDSLQSRATRIVGRLQKPLQTPNEQGWSAQNRVTPNTSR